MDDQSKVYLGGFATVLICIALVVGGFYGCTVDKNECTKTVLKSCFESGQENCGLHVRGICTNGQVSGGN